MQFDGTTEKYFNKQIRRRVVDPDTIATIWSGLLDLKKGSQSYFMRDVYWRINILDSNNRVKAALLHYDDSYFNFRVGLDYYQNDSLYLLLRELILVDSLGEQSCGD